MSENKKLNDTEDEKLSWGVGGQPMNIPKDVFDANYHDIPGLGFDLNPIYKYKCSDCGHEFWFRQPGSSTSKGAVMVKCPRCNSPHVKTAKG